MAKGRNRKRGETLAQILGIGLVVVTLTGIWLWHATLTAQLKVFLQWNGSSALSGWIQAIGAVAAIYAAHLNTINQIRKTRIEAERAEILKSLDMAKAASKVVKRARGVLRYTVDDIRHWRDDHKIRNGYISRMQNQIDVLDLLIAKQLSSRLLEPVLDARGLLAVALGALQEEGIHAANLQSIRFARQDIDITRKRLVLARLEFRKRLFALAVVK